MQEGFEIINLAGKFQKRIECAARLLDRPEYSGLKAKFRSKSKDFNVKLEVDKKDVNAMAIASSNSTMSIRFSLLLIQLKCRHFVGTMSSI